MNKLERCFLEQLLAREVIQGWDHCKKIENLYGMIRKACEKEFSEDNAITMDVFLRERFETTTKTEVEI